MNTYVSNWQVTELEPKTQGFRFIVDIKRSLEGFLFLAFNLTVASMIVALSVWISVSPESSSISSIVWLSGLLFLGLALEPKEPIGIHLLITGVVLLGLAGLFTYVDPGFVVVSGLIIAAWTVHYLFTAARQ